MKMIWSKAQTAIVKKDMREALSNKYCRITIFVAPMILATILPLIFIIIIYFNPQELKEMDSLLKVMPVNISVVGLANMMFYYLINYLMPAYFLLIPTMAASIISGQSIVGEKERKTLETLLFSPLNTREIFIGKVMGCFLFAMMVSFSSFVMFLLVSGIGSMLVLHTFTIDLVMWAVVMLLLSPAISLLAITMMVLLSAKTETFQEAQQLSGYTIIPVMIIIISQVNGYILLGAGQMALIGLAIMLVAFVTLRVASGKFKVERLMK